MAVQAAITALQALVLNVTGIREAPAYSTEAPTIFPCSVCLPYEGDMTGMGGTWRKNVDTVTLDIHVARRDLKWDIRTLTPYVDSISNMLAANPTISASVDTIVYPVPWRLMVMDWAAGNVKTICIRFLVTFKHQTVCT
jgi:hypothetical protein